LGGRTSISTVPVANALGVLREVGLDLIPAIKKEDVFVLVCNTLAFAVKHNLLICRLLYPVPHTAQRRCSLEIQTLESDFPTLAHS
jgi:hypothetical protein